MAKSINHIKTLNEKELWEMIASYRDNFHGQKPLMFWFHSNQDLDCIKAQINQDFSDKTKVFVYHRYVMQLEKEQLDYCLDVVQQGHFPVICLMNDHSITTDKATDDLISFVNENFDNYDIVFN